jgi:hypothetical protein
MKSVSLPIRRLGSVQKAIAQHEKRWGKLRTKLARKRPVFWVTRNFDDLGVRIWPTAPTRDESTWTVFGDPHNYSASCCKQFLRATGIRVRPGQCIKVRFSAEVIP